MKALKKVLTLGLVLSMVMGLAGCGQQSAAEATTTEVVQEESSVKESDTPKEETQENSNSDITITYMASQDWVQDAELELGEKFTEETGIKVDYQIIPADQYENLLMTKLNTGECTDLFGAQSGRFNIQTQVDVEKNAVDLSSESWADNVEPAAAGELSVDGKLYGQPVQDVSAVWAMAYNKQVFADLGLEIPTTYAEFKDVCDAILQSGKTPIYESVSDVWHHTLWLENAVAAAQADPTLVDALNENTSTFVSNDDLELILTQIKEMADAGYWGENYMSNTNADAAKNLASGEYVMAVANQGMGAEINAIDPSFDVDNIGYFVMPLCDNQILNVNSCGPSRFIYSGSENADAAKKYLEFMASDESLAYLTEHVAKFNQLPFSNAPSAYSETIQDFYDRYPTKENVFQASVKYFNPQWMDMGANISAMLLGEMTEEEVLADIDKMRAEQAKAASDPAWAK